LSAIVWEVCTESIIHEYTWLFTINLRASIR
jgi:hypothetical protein